jgi:hypothetical protein
LVSGCLGLRAWFNIFGLGFRVLRLRRFQVFQDFFRVFGILSLEFFRV